MEEFLHCCCQTALQQHRLVQLAGGFEQLEVLHVACTDLDDIHIVQCRLQMGRVNDFTDRQQAVFIGCFAEDTQSVHAKPLEIIR
ncbi:hypothetical protein D3C80_1886370 [compost metagenome]